MNAAGDEIASGQWFPGLEVVQQVRDVLAQYRIRAGEVEQPAGVIPFVDGIVTGVEAGAAQLPAAAGGVGGEFKLVGPAAVVGIPAVTAAQLGAARAEALAVEAAAALFGDRPLGHQGYLSMRRCPCAASDYRVSLVVDRRSPWRIDQVDGGGRVGSVAVRTAMIAATDTR